MSECTLKEILRLTGQIISKYRLNEMAHWLLKSKKNRQQFISGVTTTLLLRDIADLGIKDLRDILSVVDPQADQYSCEMVSGGPYMETLRNQVARALAVVIAKRLDYTEQNPPYTRWSRVAA